MYRLFAALALLMVTTSKFKEVSKNHPIQILFPLPDSDDEGNGKNPFSLSIAKVVPVVNLAIEDAYAKQYIPQDSISATFKNSRLSDSHGPNVAISQLVKNELDCIIGYAFVYALAPVARMTPTWTDNDSYGIPVITPIGLTMNLDDKKEYQLLTRISSPYKVVVSAVCKLFESQTWKRHVYMFHHIKEPSAPVGECFLLASLQVKLKEVMGRIASEEIDMNGSTSAADESSNSSSSSYDSACYNDADLSHISLNNSWERVQSPLRVGEDAKPEEEKYCFMTDGRYVGVHSQMLNDMDLSEFQTMTNTCWYWRLLCIREARYGKRDREVQLLRVKQAGIFIDCVNGYKKRLYPKEIPSIFVRELIIETELTEELCRHLLKIRRLRVWSINLLASLRCNLESFNKLITGKRSEEDYDDNNEVDDENKEESAELMEQLEEAIPETNDELRLASTKIHELYGFSYTANDFTDIQLSEIKVAHMKIIRGLITSRGLNLFIHQWLTGERPVFSILHVDDIDKGEPFDFRTIFEEVEIDGIEEDDINRFLQSTYRVRKPETSSFLCITQSSDKKILRMYFE